MSFFSELKRRNVFKVAVAYVIVGWLLIQIADVFFPALQLPEWTVTLVAALLILAFPVALLLSWVYELTPEGLKPTKSVEVSESITRVTGRKLDVVIITFLVFAVVFMFVDNYLPESGPFAGADIVPGSIDSAVDTTSFADQRASDLQARQSVLPNSIAVLPFTNLSDRPDDAYFAAGIYDEILSQLVNLGLTVIGRTTMAQYAAASTPISEVAQELNVETVMEGSVRYADDRVLVSAQLIDPGTSAQLWSDSYEFELSDIFAIQADIAMSIANALEVEFSADEQQGIEESRTDSPEAYALYLRSFDPDNPSGAIADLERALELDPEFSLAYARKALWHATTLSYSFDVETTAEERLALESAEKALDLNPRLGLAYLALANIHEVFWRWTEAREAFERAYELSPNDPTVVYQYGRFKRNSRDYSSAIRIGQRALELDPLNLLAMNQLGIAYRYSGDSTAAARIYRQMVTLSPMSPFAHTHLGVSQATIGNFEEAINSLRIAEEEFGPNAQQVFRYAQLAMGYALVGHRADAERMVSTLRERSSESTVGESVWALAHIALGEYDEALERLRNAMEQPSSASYTTLIEIEANPWGNPVLEEPRFREVFESFWPEPE